MSSSFDGPPPRRRQRQPLRISTDVPLFMDYPSGFSSGPPSPSNQSITFFEEISSAGNPQCLFHVICMHDFESLDPIHLPFHKDEELVIIKQEGSGWWAAMRPQGDRIGWIPGSFVLPLDRSKIVDCPDEMLWPYENLNDHPLSSVHDPWVPVSEDYRVSPFQLVTPTDLVLYKGLFDDRVRSHGCEPFPNLSNDDPSPDMEHVCVPPTPENPPHRTQISRFPCSPIVSESALQLAWATCPPSLDAVSHRDSCLCEVDDKTPLLRLTTPAISDETVPEPITSLDIEDRLVALDSVAVFHPRTCPDDSRSQSFTLPASPHLAHPNQGVSDVGLVDLATWDPDSLAEQLCVLMHTLYATIRQQDCFEWMAGRRGTDPGVTGLWQFFDTHDRIASWVQKSIVACDDAQQVNAVDFWIRVAQKCQALRNFDSLCAVVLSLSRSYLTSSDVPEFAWARCTEWQTFAMLCDMLDASNKFRHLMDVMDTAEGPSVPFVRKYLDDIKELHVENPLHQSGYDNADSYAVGRTQLDAVSHVLRHQSSQYGEITLSYVAWFPEDEEPT